LTSATYALAWSRAARRDLPGAIALFDRLRLLGADRGWVRMEAAAIVELMRLSRRSNPGQTDRLALRLQSIVPALASKEVSTHWLGARLCALGIAYHRTMMSLDDDSTRNLETIVEDLWDRAPPPDAVTASLLLAHALHEHGNRRRALEVMERALVRAQSLGIARTFVDSGEWAMSLVRELRASRGQAAGGLQDDYLDRLLQMAGIEPSPAPPVRPSSHATAELIEALTGREREILALLGRGLSNKEVGRSLKIGPETVKWHLKNLFGKLGVTTRYQAIRRAQTLTSIG